MSVCECAQIGNSNRYASIRFDYGNISLNNVNSSANRCKYYSGVLLENPYISHTTQSTFSNNSDDNSRCIGFSYNSHHMSQCNIIRNHQMTTNDGTICNYGSAQTTLSDCIIDMNTGAINIIYVYSGSVTINNCYIQSDKSTTGNVTIISTISDSDSLILYHFNSYHCDVMNINHTMTYDCKISFIMCNCDNDFKTLKLIVPVFTLISFVIVEEM